MGVEMLSTNVQNGHPEKENGASVLSTMDGQSGDLNTSVCTRQQQGATTSVAMSVSYPSFGSSVVWLQTACCRR